MYEAIFLPDGIEHTLCTIKFRLHDRNPFLIFQVVATTVGEYHQIFMILVATSCHYRVQTVDVQTRHHCLDKPLGHILIVYHAYRFASLTTLYTLCHLLHHSAAQIIVQIHLRIFGEFE